MTVEFICNGGSGGEATIDIELRDEFPGIGGLIKTTQSVAVAYRKHYSQNVIKAGHEMFLKHSIIKKLEDYFFAKGRYNYAHITRPLGSTKEGYIYEWAFGSDAFPWFYTDEDYNQLPVQLDDWSPFIAAFAEAGIDLQMDCTDADDGRISKNIVHQLNIYNVNPQSLNRLWKRIDLDTRSIGLNYEKLEAFLQANEQDISEVLKPERYKLMWLGCKHLHSNNLTDREKGNLEVLVLDYRTSTLSHLNKRGVGDHKLGIHIVSSDETF